MRKTSIDPTIFADYELKSFSEWPYDLLKLYHSYINEKINEAQVQRKAREENRLMNLAILVLEEIERRERKSH